MHCATRRIVLALFLPAVTCAVVRWSICEVALRGPADGNPFIEVQLSARFRYKNRAVTSPIWKARPAVERQMDLAARLLLTFDPFRAATVMERFMGGQQPRHATLN